VFSARGFSGAFDQDDLVVIPITAAWSNLLGNNTVIDQVLLQAATPAQAGAVKAQATGTLLQRHGFVNPAEADFEVHTLKDFTAQEEQTATAVEYTLFLAAVALLLVAALDLTERRGLAGRASVRAARPAPLVEELTRAAMVTVLGLALAAATVGLVRHLIGGIPSPELRLSSLAGGVGFGVLVALVAWVQEAIRSGRFVRLGQSSRPGLGSRLGILP